MDAKKLVLSYGSIMLLASAVAFAEKERREPSAEIKQAFQSCFTELGVTVAEGARPELTSDQRGQLDSCLQAKGVSAPRGREGRRGPPPNHEAMKACLAEAGVSLPTPAARGEKPVFDDATRAAFDQCRAKLGEKKSVGSSASAM